MWGAVRTEAEVLPSSCRIAQRARSTPSSPVVAAAASARARSLRTCRRELSRRSAAGGSCSHLRELSRWEHQRARVHHATRLQQRA
jgi:hypothetical protein